MYVYSQVQVLIPIHFLKGTTTVTKHQTFTLANSIIRNYYKDYYNMLAESINVDHDGDYPNDMNSCVIY